MARHRKNIYEVEFLDVSAAADQNSDSQNDDPSLAATADVYEISFAAVVSAEAVVSQKIGNLCLDTAEIAFSKISRTAVQSDTDASPLEIADRTFDSAQKLALPELVGEVINTIQHVDGRVSMPQILETISDAGASLDLDGLHDFMQLFSVHPDVTPRPDGDFDLKNHPSEYNTPNNNSMSNGQRNEDALSAVEIVKVLKSIDKSEELKRVKESSQIANNRRRGHNRKSNFKKRQGKSHGHKKTIEELIDEMNAKNQPTT